MGYTGLEPVASPLSGVCSNQAELIARLTLDRFIINP